VSADKRQRENSSSKERKSKKVFKIARQIERRKGIRKRLPGKGERRTSTTEEGGKGVRREGC